MRAGQKSGKKPTATKPKQKAEDTQVGKLGTELKEVQSASRSIVKPEVSIISDPELYFSFMEIAAMNLYAQRRSAEALKIMTQLFTQYQEFKNQDSNEYDTSDMFVDSHTSTKKDKEDK